MRACVGVHAMLCACRHAAAHAWCRRRAPAMPSRACTCARAWQCACSSLALHTHRPQACIAFRGAWHLIRGAEARALVLRSRPYGLACHVTCGSAGCCIPAINDTSCWHGLLAEFLPVCDAGIHHDILACITIIEHDVSVLYTLHTVAVMHRASCM